MFIALYLLFMYQNQEGVADKVDDAVVDNTDADLKIESTGAKANLDPEEVKRMLKNLKNDMKPSSEQPGKKFRNG